MQKIIFIFFWSLFIGKLLAQSYSPELAAQYAEKWWDKRNPAYIDYDDYGGQSYGNCANFVSQCLIAGGLNLKTGTDGNGTGVDQYYCIPGAVNLAKHLKYRSDVVYCNSTTNNDDCVHTDVGDPVSLCRGNNEYYHTLFCHKVEGAINKYGTNSSDRINQPITYFNGDCFTYFHINNSIPVHCTNCIQDEDETDIDCGGSCPPCQHAPSHKSYTTNTSPDKPLPSETYAISSITAGNASVKVYSGQNASFYSVGTINLKDGFHAEPGSNFFAQPKSMRLQATADCQAFCDPVIYNTCTREPGNPNGYNDTWYWEITNAKSVSVILDQYDGFNHSVIMDVYSNTFVPSQDGEVMLWNLEDGTPCYESSCRVSGSVNGNCNTDHHLFYYHVTILSCQDIPFEYTGSLFVLNTVCTKKLLSSSVNSAERNANMQAIFNQDELEYVSSIEKGLIVQNNDLQVYPNPAKDQITVSYKFTGDSYAEIIIYDVNGKELMKEKLTNEHNTNLISIDISSFTNGVYFLTLQSKTSSQKTKFIVLKQ